MRWFKAEYQHRGSGKGHWGHTVRLIEEPEQKSEKFLGQCQMYLQQYTNYDQCADAIGRRVRTVAILRPPYCI